MSRPTRERGERFDKALSLSLGLSVSLSLEKKKKFWVSNCVRFQALSQI